MAGCPLGLPTVRKKSRHARAVFPQSISQHTDLQGIFVGKPHTLTPVFYVLMTNHVHLLATPAEPGAVSRMMQAIGRRYVASFNARYRRTGTLWEGRFKSALVDSERYLLTCYRYIELNPVPAATVAAPADYRWSSHARNAEGVHGPHVTPHAMYLRLGTDQAERHQAYRRLFDPALAPEDTATSACIHSSKRLGVAIAPAHRLKR